MSLRFTFPLTGLAGSIFGIFGIGGGSGVKTNYINDSNLNQPVVSIPSYLQKLKLVDPIEVSYSCNNLKSGLSSGTFIVKLKENELSGKEDDLVGGKEVRANIGYGFKVKDDSDFEEFKGLVGRGKPYMTVFSRYDGGLRVVLRESNVNYGRNSDVTLGCKVVEGGNASEVIVRKNDEKVFGDSVELDSSKKTVSLDSWKGSLRVSLYNCPSEVKSGDVSTCSLKLTDLSGRKWNTKVNVKANLEFSPAKDR